MDATIVFVSAILGNGAFQNAGVKSQRPGMPLAAGQTISRIEACENESPDRSWPCSATLCLSLSPQSGHVVDIQDMLRSKSHSRNSKWIHAIGQGTGSTCRCRAANNDFDQIRNSRLPRVSVSQMLCRLFNYLSADVLPLRSPAI
ncbi:hypothetical protein J3459_010191 [Metarhizium acridum]|uniref:uncharacterized protein n=1 Tax=Metarhizium acridum TaxID=92637 RepID=UPI001C6BB6D4|nr:hypothetical protein J3459_010191 [Metarhizium acridum]KAG8425148.1 hypothetical protein J3458_001880 [Metarhizium acridum]